MRPLPVFQTSVPRLPTASLPDPPVLPSPDFPARQIGPELRPGALEGVRQGVAEIAEVVRFLTPDYSDADLDIPAVRSLIRASFASVGCQEWKDWQFTRLAMTHPLYHCFYDVDSLPRGMRDMHFTTGESAPLTPAYLEGIMVGD